MREIPVLNRMGAVARLCLVLIAGFLSGCSILDMKSHETVKSPFKLPPIVAPREAVQLDILFVDRPVADSLLGPALWNDVDEIGGLSAPDRNRLKQNGWRIGHVSSHPPRALEELLALTADRSEFIDTSRRLVGRRISVTAGTDFPIEVTDKQTELHARLSPHDSEKTYSDARGILRVRLDRERDGWVKLQFLPEIHHGQEWLRPVATAFNWTNQSRQNVIPLYDQQFSLNLNIGEMAILTAVDGDNSVVGHSFFRSLDENGRLQRLLLIRVADMRRLEPVYRD